MVSISVGDGIYLKTALGISQIQTENDAVGSLGECQRFLFLFPC